MQHFAIDRDTQHPHLSMMDLREHLSHVRWLGGGSGAGKSATAGRLAAKHGATLYDTDAAMTSHAARSSPADSPNLAAFAAMSMDARWVDRTPEVMLRTFHWFEGEGFDLIVEDLRALPRDRPVLVEGFRLLPNRVAPLLTAKRHALWLLPTPAFRERAFAARGSTWTIADWTSNPDRARANLLARDALFTDRLRGEVRALRLHALEIDGALDEAAVADRAGGLLFGSAPAASFIAPPGSPP